MADKLFELFGVKKPIIGMIHLAGNNSKDKVNRALEEISIFEEEEINGFIVEDYHGSLGDVVRALEEISKQNSPLIMGINSLRDPYQAFSLAEEYGAKFVQFDSVQTQDIQPKFHRIMWKNYPNIMLFGGVRFKYTSSTGNMLEGDLKEGMLNCDVVVTTGEGTGIETPIQKLKDFKKIMGDYSLIVGAGVTSRNISSQLNIANGAIVGSFLKGGDTTQKTKGIKVRELMTPVKYLRRDLNL